MPECVPDTFQISCHLECQNIYQIHTCQKHISFFLSAKPDTMPEKLSGLTSYSMSDKMPKLNQVEYEVEYQNICQRKNIKI